MMTRRNATKTRLQRLLGREFQLRDTLGRRQSYSAAEHMRHYGRKRTWQYLSIVYVALLASDPMDLGEALSFGPYLIAWVLGTACYLMFRCALFFGVGLLAAALPRLPVYAPIVSLLALAPTLALLELALWAALGEALGPDIYAHMAFLLVTVLMFECVFLRFVAAPVSDHPETEEPAVAPSRGASPAEADRAESAAPPERRQRKLHIGAQPLPLADLISLEARQHHVVARHLGGTLVQRARLADIVAQTGAEDGLQPHRSWWVAADALSHMERQDGKTFLRLTDGTRVPVARGRMQEVDRWLQTRLSSAA